MLVWYIRKHGALTALWAVWGAGLVIYLAYDQFIYLFVVLTLFFFYFMVNVMFKVRAR